MNGGGYDVNNALQGIFQMMNAGRDPRQIMQLMLQQNPQMQQAMATLQNMAQGKSPQEFITQLARQKGVSEQNMAQIMSLLNR
jgi:hypothetical protein